MKVLVVSNLKGGVGKSTLSAALAVRALRLSNGKDRRVAVVDADDSQRTLVKWFMLRGDPDKPLVAAGDYEPASVVEKLDHQGFDLVIIDTAPNDASTIADAIAVADAVLIPLRTSPADLASTHEAAQLAKRYRKPLILVLNDVVAEDKLADTYRQALTEKGFKVAATVVHHLSAHSTAYGAGRTAAELEAESRDKGASAKRGKSKIEATAEIDALWAEVATILGVKP